MMRSLPLIVTLIGYLALPTARGQEKPSEGTWPQLITSQTPGLRWDDEGVALPKDILRRCGSGLFRRGYYAGSTPFISPSGNTVYVPDPHELIALDAESGKIRFAFRHRILSLQIQDLGEAGIRIDFHQPPEADNFVVLEHDTGRELRRGKRDEPARKGAGSITFANGRRGIKYRDKPQRKPVPPSLRDSIALLWDLENDRLLLELGEIDSAPVIGGLNAREDRLVFHTDRELRIVDTELGKLLHQVDMNVQSNGSPPAMWDASGKKVYAWRIKDKDWQIVEIDAVTGGLRVIVSPGDYLRGNLILSPNGKMLATYRSARVQPVQKAGWVIIDLDNLSQVAFFDLPQLIARAAFSPDSKSLWLLGEAGLVRCDIANKQIATPRADPAQSISTLSFSADGRRLFGAAGLELLTWDVATGQEIAPRQQFSAALPAADFRKCAKIDSTGTLTLWYGDSNVRLLENGTELSKFYAGNSRETRSHVVSSDLRQIVHDAYWGELNQAELRTGKLIRQLLPKVTPRESYLMAISPDSKTLAGLHEANNFSQAPRTVEIELWDLNSGKLRGKLSQIGEIEMEMHFSGDSQELRVWHHRKLTRWNVATRKKIDERSTQHEPSLYYGFSPDRKYYLTDGNDKLQLVNTVTDEIVKTWDCFDWRATATAFSPDGKLIAVGAPEGPVFLVEVGLSRP